MKLFEHKIIAVAIAFTSLFATVGPVFAESVYIQNTVSSYSNTGGDGVDVPCGTSTPVASGASDGRCEQSEPGRGGQDGEDGEDGESGSDGATVISGTGSATVKIKTTVNGETIVDIDESYSGNGAVSASGTEVHKNGNSELSASERSNILRLLEQIRLILINYVSKLF